MRKCLSSKGDDSGSIDKWLPEKEALAYCSYSDNEDEDADEGEKAKDAEDVEGLRGAESAKEPNFSPPDGVQG